MLHYSKIADTELAAQLCNHNHAAFTEIYKRHWKSMYIYARSILKDSDEASDVVQDIFTTLWNRGPYLQIDTGLKAYLLTATRHRALRIIHNSSRADAYAAELAQSFSEEAGSTDDNCNFRELCTILDDAVENLPSTMQAVYRKSKHEELSHRSIAEELGITEHSSRTLLNRALNSLRTKLTTLLSLAAVFWYF
ncbi:RNA polymerase sigma factor [Arcticibacter tournemirensis]|uniref:Sigma-70 family RNA polymerase sigma factor n=1 Tax=Arcticibacter tournemirensis TaxID=699437 RepID=A0A4Q0M5V8_9SPHI|nr:sigma-70 family RNA polymerase sigma factor [Arcticibacter tournemirensis]RXF68203.1 sigma-70 family RNA polymerase sigma factor [Arcticibacter tournemirensis]